MAILIIIALLLFLFGASFLLAALVGFAFQADREATLLAKMRGSTTRLRELLGALS